MISITLLTEMNKQKIALAVVMTGVMVAVAVAPMLLSSALAARTTTCTNGGDHPKECGSPPAKCETVKAGEGQGGGEIKSDTCP
jgi:NADH:ubiquinone oxidoreductase subunit 3 (subunit A)